MEWNEKESKIKVRRGKRISCVNANDDTKSAILRKAVGKRKHYHKNLYDSDEIYSLLYESREVIDKVPGSDEDFVLYKYRSEIAKDYCQWRPRTMLLSSLGLSLHYRWTGFHFFYLAIAC